jgi:hypothetical protein
VLRDCVLLKIQLWERGDDFDNLDVLEKLGPLKAEVELHMMFPCPTDFK